MTIKSLCPWCGKNQFADAIDKGAARQALIDSMAAVSIASPEQMADMVLSELENRGWMVARQ